MYYLSQLTEPEFEIMAEEINENKSENELFQLIGEALHNSGFTVSTSNTVGIMQTKMFNQDVESISLIKSIDFLTETEPLSTEEAIEEGGKFWERFKDKLRSVICNDLKIKELIEGDGSLKDFLVIAIPLILAALGITVLSPMLLIVIAAVFALIVKVGFNAYCSLI